jgi:ATP-dependent helicase/nuclease subunit B
VSAREASTLIVRPDSGRVELALIEASRRAAFIDAGAHRTFSQLVDACGGPAFAGLAPADPWLVRSLVAVEAPVFATPIFGEIASTADFALQADVLRGELWSQDVSPSFLSDLASRSVGRTGEKLRAICSVFEAVDAKLNAQRLIDRRAVVHLATRRLKEQGLPEGLLRFEAIEVRDLHDLGPARLAFVDALARACVATNRSFRLVVPWAGSPRTDAFVGGVARFFEKRWESLGGAELIPEASEQPLAVHLRQLFAAEVTPDTLPGLALVSCATPRDEARAIAGLVKQRLAAGTPSERIAIAFRDLADDTEMLVEQLDALGVPCRARLGLPLSVSPLGRLAASLLSLADDDFPVDNVAALLESRYARALSKGLPPGRGAFAEAGVRNDVIGARGGQGAWLVRLGALLDRRTGEAARRNALTTEVRELATLIDAVKHVQTLARSIPARGPAASLLESWWKAVGALGIDEALSEPEPSLRGHLLEAEVDRAVARDQASYEALSSLVRSLRLAMDRSGLGATSMDRRTFARWVSLAMSEVNLQSRGPRAGAVWLVDVRDLPGASFDAVFVGGLLDGRFPGRSAPAMLLSDDERAEINAAASTTLFRLSVSDDGVALPHRLAEDRLLLHHALIAAPSVTLSYPRSDARGREALRSPFVDAIERVLPNLPVTVRAYRPVPLLDEVQSSSEFSTRAALEIWSPLETRQSLRDRRAPALAALIRSEPWAVNANAMAAIEKERLKFFSRSDSIPGRFTGAVLDSSVLERLESVLQWDSTHPISASQLESWANCHFLGLGRRILKLQDDDRAGEEMDNRALGDLLHAALKRLVPRLQAQGRWPASKPQLDAVAKELDEALTIASNEVARSMPVGHHLLFDISVERARGELLRLLFDSSIAPIAGAVPKAFESTFGRKDSEAAVRHVSIPPALPHELPVFLVGAIDRLDVAPSQVAVIDYKLSRSGTPKARLEALLRKDFQLPLYLFVARALYPEKSVDAAWVALRKSGSLVLSRVLKDEVYTLEDLLAVDLQARRKAAMENRPNLANAVHGLQASLRKGDFSARPLDCEYCDLRSVCRISARRLTETAEVD